MTQIACCRQMENIFHLLPKLLHEIAIQGILVTFGRQGDDTMIFLDEEKGSFYGEKNNCNTYKF